MLHPIWKQKKWTADAFLIYNATLNFNELALSERGKNFIYAEDANGNPFSPSWYTLNLRAQYQISKTITLTTALENITNQLYRPYSSGISAPGRNLIVSLKYGL
jgi:hemoglobin/transferrin/lactoferrin receptor protein